MTTHTADPVDDRQNSTCGGRTSQSEPETNATSKPDHDPVTPEWRLGDRVSWCGPVGSFIRALGDGIHAEIRIEQRVYLVRNADLRPG